MRIITGKARGAKLKTPKGENTRPTADRIKESLFNILSYTVRETKVLDLFSGTGNLGLEAVSRGAEKAVLVDKNRESISVIKYNALHTRLQEQVEVIQGDVFSVVAKLADKKQVFDIIFADPPYHNGYELKLLETLDKHAVLAPEGIIVIEHGRADLLPEAVGKFEKFRVQNYGATTSISFYRHKSEQEEV